MPPPRFVEVSHVIEPGMVTYPGLPVPEAKVIVDHDTSRERYAGKSEFLIASLHICGNTGTYVDSPVHRHRGALDLAGLPLERLALLPVRLFDARSLGRTVGPQLFAGTKVPSPSPGEAGRPSRSALTSSCSAWPYETLVHLAVWG
jgi:arylformamidase